MSHLSSSANSAKLAVFSCANYTNGYFNAYKEAATINDLDVVLHLGDYIYEYGMFEDDGVTPAYASKNAKNIARELPSSNDKELLTLSDYRKRYALYRSDDGLKSLHKVTPFICVWDDHKIANDTYKDGAENHNENDGDFQERKLDALKAYFEWLPIRPFESDNTEIIYRSFKFGDILDLYMLDTRVLARDKQLDYSNYFDSVGAFNQSKFVSDMSDTSRTMLGSEQLTLLQNSLASSNAKWQVLGQQVLMGKMSLPSELLILITQLNVAKGDAKTALLSKMNILITELVSIKTRLLSNDPSLTVQEKARVTTVMPYNLDAWDGYSYEREVIFGTLKALDKKLVVLSGDTHNSWASDLKDVNGDNIGIELATKSVSSPGMEDYVGLSTMTASMEFEGAIALLIDDLKYTNLNQRGFMTVIFTKDEVKSKWTYIDSNDSVRYTIDNTRAKYISCTDKTLIL